MPNSAEISGQWRVNFTEVSDISVSILRKVSAPFCGAAKAISETHGKIAARKANLPGTKERLKMRQTMKPLELKPEDLPMTLSLKTQDGSKKYVLVMTKQEKLLLNKPLGSTIER